MAPSLAVRALAFVVFFAGVAGATYVAYDQYGPEEGLAAVKVTSPAAPASALPGATAQVVITLTNLGTMPLNVTAVSETDGFTVTAATPARLPPGGTATLNLRVTSADDANPGPTVVKVRLETETGRVVGRTTVTIDVVEPKPPGLTVTPSLPVFLAGQNATLAYEIHNPAVAQQEVSVGLVGTSGTVSPERAALGPSQSRAGTITVPIREGATGTVEFVVRAAVTGSALGTDVPVTLHIAEPNRLYAQAVRPTTTAAPDGTVAVPFVLVWTGDAATNLSATSDGAPVALTTERVAALSSTGTFATLSTAAGTKTVTFTTAAGPAVEAAMTMVSPTGATVPMGGRVKVDYVGRLADGGVFDTSRPAIAQGPFAKAPMFNLRAAGTYQPFELVAQVGGGAIEGFATAVIGMHVGDTKTVVIPPEQAYGERFINETYPATATLPRDESGQRTFPGIQRALVENPQTGIDLTGKQAGDRFELTSQGGVPIVYDFEIQRIDETTVDLLWVLEMGQRFTFFEMWPNSTEVVAVNETSVTFRTTPSSGPDDRFEWLDQRAHPHAPSWGEVATVAAVTDTEISIAFAPPLGLQYQAASAYQPGPPSLYTVVGRDEEGVHVIRQNPSPFAGQTLTFDITVVSLADGVQADDGHDHEH